MSYDGYDRSSDRAHAGDDDYGHRPGVAPGRVSLTSRLPPSAAGPAQPAEPATDGHIAMGAVQQKSSGAPLPPAIQRYLGASYGADLGSVRVHTDSASATAADKAGAEAFTHGNDIFFGSGRYQPESQHGGFVLAHEVAHVVQQGGQPAVQAHLDDPAAQAAVETGSSGDAAEREASAAAAAAVSGRRATISAAAPRIRFFKQGDGSESQGGHAYMTEQALQGMGLNAQEARAGRFGNWERDLSQALTPATMGAVDAIMPILNIMAIKEFGRGINISEFGSYDPVEHIDNPAGLRSDGALDQWSLPQVGDDSDINQAEFTMQGPPAPAQRSGVAWTDVDERYSNTADETLGENVMNPEDVPAFQVDESGIPVYMNTSKEMLVRNLQSAARLGRRGNDGRGPRLFSSAIHIMQDYFAHSNFCEIAVNILIRNGTLRVRDESGQMVEGAALQRRGVLNTRIHANTADGGQEAANLTHAGREVMTTGTFNLRDTVASILEEVSDKWKQLNPFEDKSSGPSELTEACLDYMDMTAPTNFNATGTKIAGVIRRVKDAVGHVTPTAANVVEGVGDVAAAPVETAGGLVSGGFGLLNEANAFLGGDDDYFDEERSAVEGATSAVANTVRGPTDRAAEGIRNITKKLEAEAKRWEKRQHILRDAYRWWTENVNPMQWLIEMARAIPLVGDDIAEMIEDLGNTIRDELEDILGKAWNAVIDLGVEAIDGVIGQVRGGTNIAENRNIGRDGPRGPEWLPEGARSWIGDTMAGAERAFGGLGDLYDPATGRPYAGNEGIAPGAYTPPSHTEVAKDHAPLSQGARDGATDHPDDPISRDQDPQHNPDHAHEHHGGDGDHHGHVHEGAFLSRLAQQLASMATRACSEPVNRAWNAVETGGAAAAADFDNDIRDKVDDYFAHPADCNYWQGTVRAAAGSEALGPAILEHLSSAAAGSPSTPAEVADPHEHDHDHGHGRHRHAHGHDDHDHDHDHDH